MKTALILLTGLLALATSAASQGHHEYAPIEEKTINYKNWTFKDLKDEQKSVDLRQWMEGKKLVLVVYFAPWCPNWHNEAPIVTKLHEKYGAEGLGVIAVSEYASLADVRKHFGDKGAPYPVVTESLSRDERDKTTHYAYRQATGDKRNWGSPYNVFLDPAKIAKEGDTLAEKTWVVNGELIEADADKFVREHLSLNRQDEQEKQDK
ncbi:MAG TPA: redoxin family protein [Pyrinomonadaceae bacterium]|nr:redoxin family protein [Pyrinomonadaceae bacterium]